MLNSLKDQDVMSEHEMYEYKWQGGEAVSLPLGKVVCVGRNYAEHAKELNNPIPTEPLLFMKPATSLVDFAKPVKIPTGFGEVHYESEISILIGSRLSINEDGSLPSQEQAKQAICGVGAALDLTLRDLQSKLKEKGQPWEKAKAFDGSCPVSAFVPVEQAGDLFDMSIALEIDGVQVQSGSSKDMLTSVYSLLSYIAQFFTLMPGDVVLTGTPKGVGRIEANQSLKLSLNDKLEVESSTC